MSSPVGTGEPELVLALDRVGPGNLALVGGKALHLGMLRRAGMPVPAGFCVTTTAFRAFVEAGGDGGREFSRVIAGQGGEHGSATGEAARALRETWLCQPIPAAVAAAVVSAWRALGSERAYAVRSSAVAEDSAAASFAGQHDSFLNVQGEAQLLECVRRCWASLFSDRAIEYRARRPAGGGDSAMAVLVQELVPAEASGVAFTVDPTTGDGQQLVIEAVWGLGEALVQGRAAADRYRLERPSLRCRTPELSRKTTRVVPAAGGGVCPEPVPVAQVETPCLDPVTLARLGTLALQAERLLGKPQDLEWAAVRGAVHVLQSRPVTTRPVAKTDTRVWSLANVGEVMPDVLTPMSWSLLKRCTDAIFVPLLRRFGLDLEKEPFIERVAGRVYADVTVFERLVGLTGVPLGEAFGGEQDRLAPPSRTTRPVPRMPLRQKLNLLVHLPGLVFAVAPGASTRRSWGFVEQLRGRCLRLAAEDLAALPDAALIPRIQSIIAGCFPSAGAALAAGAGLGMFIALRRVCRRWLNDTDGTLVNRLLAGVGGVDSAEAALDLWRLAAWARGHEDLATAVLAAGDFGALEAALGSLPTGAEFLRRWRAFMSDHGHHTRGEIDVHNARWSETPDLVLGWVKGYLAVPEAADPLAMHRQRTSERERLQAESRQRLRSPLQRRVFTWLLAHTQAGLALRENLKSNAVKVIAEFRRTLLEAGTRLVRRGLLRHGDEVFFLTLDEVAALLRGEPTVDPEPFVTSRRAEYDWYCTLTPPPVVLGSFDPTALASPAVPGTGGPADSALTGIAVSAGVATGPVRVILRAETAEQVRPGEVLVIPFSDPGWTPHFLTAAAIVMDLGGMLSHGSIIARECGVPAVVNVGAATTRLRTGQVVRVDGDRGVVTVLSA